jgi:selenocysteine lyase/cysteine desulfurase
LTKEVIDRENSKGGSKIRMCVVDALSSLPGVRLPFEAVSKLVQDHGILSLIDGAHAIGQIELNIRELDPDFFITNCHKWLCAPRGCAILYVAKRNQGFIHPTTINYAYQFHEESSDTSSFALEHDLNTVDPTPFLCVGAGM